MDLKKVEQGSAQDFRKTINDNFAMISENLSGIEYSEIEPGQSGGPPRQSKGCFWFKIIK